MRIRYIFFTNCCVKKCHTFYWNLAFVPSGRYSPFYFGLRDNKFLFIWILSIDNSAKFNRERILRDYIINVDYLKASSALTNIKITLHLRGIRDALSNNWSCKDSTFECSTWYFWQFFGIGSRLLSSCFQEFSLSALPDYRTVLSHF